MQTRLASIFRSPFFWLFTVAAAIVVIPLGFIASSWLSSKDGASRQSRAILARSVPQGVINEETGAYRSVRRGDPVADVKRHLGEPIESDGVFSPQVAWHASWNGFNPPTCRNWRRKSGDFYAMVYREVVFNIVGGKVCSYEVAGSGWSTTGGTRAGDSIEDVRARFGVAACEESNFTEDPFWKQWTCVGKTDSGIRLQLAGDPVSSIGVVAGK